MYCAQAACCSGSAHSAGTTAICSSAHRFKIASGTIGLAESREARSGAPTRIPAIPANPQARRPPMVTTPSKSTQPAPNPAYPTLTNARPSTSPLSARSKRRFVAARFLKLASSSDFASPCNTCILDRRPAPSISIQSFARMTLLISSPSQTDRSTSTAGHVPAQRAAMDNTFLSLQSRPPSLLGSFVNRSFTVVPPSISCSSLVAGRRIGRPSSPALNSRTSVSLARSSRSF